MEVIAEGPLQDELARWLRKVGQTREAIAAAGKSMPWKLAVAAAMKAHTTATNRWPAEKLALGNLHEVSRKVQARRRQPDPNLPRMIALSPSPKTCPLSPAPFRLPHPDEACLLSAVTVSELWHGVERDETNHAACF